MDTQPVTPSPIPGPAPSPAPAAAAQAAVCPTCHLPVLPTWYFCPNCGTKLGEKPLSTSVLTQAGIYLFSIFLPVIAFLGIKFWPGMKYLRSSDWTRKQIGIVAIGLMILSTIVIIWWSIVWFEGFMQAASGGLIGGGSGSGLGSLGL